MPQHPSCVQRERTPPPTPRLVSSSSSSVRICNFVPVMQVKRVPSLKILRALLAWSLNWWRWWRRSLASTCELVCRQCRVGSCSRVCRLYLHMFSIRSGMRAEYVQHALTQHTLAYVSIRQIRQHTSECVSIRQHTSAYVSRSRCYRLYLLAPPAAPAQLLSCVSIRQHKSAYVSVRQLYLLAPPAAPAQQLSCSPRQA